MEMLIFNHILCDSLMPWLVRTADIQQMRDNLRQLSVQEPETLKALYSALSQLLMNKPTLSKWLHNHKYIEGEKAMTLTYSTDLPAHTDIPSKFYKSLIEYESVRIYSAYLNLSDKYQGDEDLLVYHTENTLRNIKQYIRTASKKLKESHFECKEPLELTPFVLFYLKYRLITLYFSIQIINRDLLEPVWELHDFYLLELEETAADFHDIQYNPPPSKAPVPKKITSKSLSFGFKGDEMDLRNLITVLCNRINLLDLQVTGKETLIKVLTADDLSLSSDKIKFGCNSNLLTHVVDSLRPKLPKLTYSNIEKSGLFYTEGGIPIRQSLFSNSKSNNPLSNEKKEEINKIFRENHM